MIAATTRRPGTLPAGGAVVGVGGVGGVGGEDIAAPSVPDIPLGARYSGTTRKAK